MRPRWDWAPLEFGAVGIRRRWDSARRCDLAFPPVQYAKRAQCVPPTRFADVALEREVNASRVNAVEQPAAVWLPLRPYDLDGLRHPRLRLGVRSAEVVQCRSEERRVG